MKNRTLRLPDELDGALRRGAAAANMSVHAWIVLILKDHDAVTGLQALKDQGLWHGQGAPTDFTHGAGGLAGHAEPPPLDARPPDSVKGKAMSQPFSDSVSDTINLREEHEANKKALKEQPACTCTPAARGGSPEHVPWCPARGA